MLEAGKCYRIKGKRACGSAGNAFWPSLAKRMQPVEMRAKKPSGSGSGHCLIDVFQKLRPEHQLSCRDPFDAKLSEDVFS